MCKNDKFRTQYERLPKRLKNVIFSFFCPLGDDPIPTNITVAPDEEKLDWLNSAVKSIVQK